MSAIFYLVSHLIFELKIEEKNIFLAGKEGQDKVKETLEQSLDDNYVALFGVPVKNGDIDCLLALFLELMVNSDSVALESYKRLKRVKLLK